MGTKVMDASQDSEALQRRFAEFDQLCRKSPIGLATLDAEMRFVQANEALAGFLQATSDALPGRALRDALGGRGDALLELAQEAQRTGQARLQREVTLRAASELPGLRHFLAYLYPLGGESRALGLALVETTERKTSEDSLRQSEARYRDLLEHSVFGVCRVTTEGAVRGANSAMLRILGCSTPEELPGLNFLRDVFRFPDQQAQLLAECRSQGMASNTETEWKRRDGGLVAVRLHLRQLASGGEILEVIAEDITELRALERQLQHAQKFEAIGQLAGGIAHDFNNVIGAILGWAELGFEQNRSVPQAAERFTRIREQAERAASLTRELLAFARRQVLQPRAVDLNSVVNGLVTFLDRVIGRDIVLEVQLSPLDAIKADQTQVEQVLMNLCLNARDAMPDGGRLLIESGMVEVDQSYSRFYPGVAPGRYAVLSVSDSGQGMDNQTLERVFEPFFTTKEQGKGTGLGLSTVYGIVKQHGGFLHVYSEPGQGSLFRVYFPAMPGAGVAESAVVAVPRVEELRGTETVLLADDHESIREMARQSLSGLGYRVFCAADGEEALRLCEQHTPQVAVLDLVMPKLGGVATAEKLAQRFPGIALIFTSGYSRDRGESAEQVPNASYLQKPYSPSNLGRLLREVLSAAKSKP